MSTGTIPCALGLGSTALAAWRDAALPREQMVVIHQHVPSCRACQLRLAEWDALDGAIRAERPPEPSPQLWRDVRAAMVNLPRRGRRQTPRRQILGGIVAAAAVILLVASFARVLQLHGDERPTAISGTPTPIPTAAPAAFPITGTPLSWRQAALPPGSGSSNDVLTIALSPADGTLAYACYAISANTTQGPEIWMTHDRAATWALAGRLPASGLVSDCPISVDRVRDSTLVVSVWAQDPRTLTTGITDYLSLDGGHTWTQTAQLQNSQSIQTQTYQHVSQLSTSGGTVYGLVETTTYQRGAPTNPTSHLSISHDGLKTWLAIDQNLTASH